MDYDNIYRSACEFFGADRIEDRTWDEIERSGTFKPWEKHTYKFEIDISDHDMGVDEVKQILEDHGYHAEQRFDRRFKNDRSTNLILAVVSEKSKEITMSEIDDYTVEIGVTGTWRDQVIAASEEEAKEAVEAALEEHLNIDESEWGDLGWKVIGVSKDD